jgi:hypothetical protein
LITVVYLLTTTFTANQVDYRFVLNVAIRKGTGVLELISVKDQTLVVRRDFFLVLNLGLDVADGIGRLDVQGDGLSGESFDEDLHWSVDSF